MYTHEHINLVEILLNVSVVFIKNNKSYIRTAYYLVSNLYNALNLYFRWMLGNVASLIG